MVNNDFDEALAFRSYLGPRVPDIQTQEAGVMVDTPKRTRVQGVTGGDAHAGEKGVLDLSTMEWTPGEGKSRTTCAKRKKNWYKP